MDVQQAELSIADVPEAVRDSDRGRDVVAGPRPDDVVADDELRLAPEHVEGVDVIRVAVRIDALEVRAEPELECLELGELREDAVEAFAPGDELPFVRPQEDAVAQRIASPFTVQE